MKRSDDRLRSSPVTRAASCTTDDAVVAELPWLRRLAQRLAAEDAEDLVQDLWLLAQRDRPRARTAGGLRPWLATAMRNRLRSVRRSATARSARERSWVALDEASAEPEQQVVEADVARALDQALASLSEGERALLRQRFFDGRSAADIAAQEGIPAATVRTRVRRSLHRLHGELRSRHGDRPKIALAAGAIMPALPSSRTIATGALMAKVKGLIAAGAIVGVAALGFSWASGRAQTGSTSTEASAAARDAGGPGDAPSTKAADSDADSASSAAAAHRERQGSPGPREPGHRSTPHAATNSAPPPTGLELPRTTSVRQCATAVHQHDDCDFLDPDPEVLEEMAACGVVRYDFPAMFAQLDWTPQFEREWLDLVGATEGEREQLIGLADDYRDELFADLEAIGREVGLPPWDTDVTLLTAVVELSEAVGDDNVAAASRTVAQERAGTVDPPESLAGLPVAERFLRLFSDVGGGFERKLAEHLGQARARELRVAQDGWPGLKFQTGARCPQ